MNKQFGRKMDQYVDGNRNLFWKEVSEEKVESCSRIKDGNGRLALGEDSHGWIILRIYIR